MTPRRSHRPAPPLDAADLDRLALGYAGRYATTRARLFAYLGRKLRERGWAGEGAPPVDAIVQRFAELGYVDDGAVAEARGRSLAARGYGARRLGQALHALGIAQEDAAPTRAAAEDEAWETALRFARRRRLGPFAPAPLDEAASRRAFGAMMRAGHAPDVARRILAAAPGHVPSQDDG